MPEPLAPRVPIRLIGWTLFVLLLLGLGVFLHEVFHHGPRCIIPLNHPSIDWVSPDGSFVVTAPTPVPFNQFLGGGLAPGLVLPMTEPPATLDGSALQGPFEIWNTRSGRRTGTYLAPKEHYFQGHVYSPSGRYLAALETYPPDPPRPPDHRDYFHLVDLHEARASEFPLKGAADPNLFPSMVRFSPIERLVFVHDREQGSFLFATARGEMVHALPTFSIFLGFVADESIMFLNLKEAKLEVWDPRSHKLVFTLPGAGTAALSPDGRTAAAMLANALVMIDLLSLQVRRFRSMPEAEPSFQFSPDGRTLAIFFGSKVELWDVPTRKQRHGEIVDIHKSVLAAEATVFSPDSTLLAIVCEPPTGPKMMVWDVSSNRLLWSKRIDNSRCESRFSPDSTVLFLQSELGKLEDLEARTGKPRHVIASSGWLPRFTRDHRYVTLSTDLPREPGFLEKTLGDWWPFKGPDTLHHVRVVEVASGKELASLSGAGLEEAWLSDDGQTLVTKHKENDQYYLRCLDLPIREPPRWILAVQLGLAVIAILFAWRWRRSRKAGQSQPTTEP